MPPVQRPRTAQRNSQVFLRAAATRQPIKPESLRHQDGVSRQAIREMPCLHTETPPRTPYLPSYGRAYMLTEDVQCDLQRPGCGNCARAGVDCPGYRDQTDAMFVHMTDHTVTRTRPRRQSDQTSLPSPRALPKAVYAEFGIELYYRVHVMQRPCDDNVATITEGCLPNSMRALGLAACASSAPEQMDKMISAQRYYTMAVSDVNASLRSAMTANSDATLLSVVILSYFEVIAGRGQTSLDSWVNHVTGTAALIHQRGAQQIRTAEGRELFMAATNSIVPKCLRLAAKIPQGVHDVWRACAEAFGSSSCDPISNNHSAWFRLVDWYSDYINKPKSASSVVTEALEIDRAFAEAFEGAPEDWTFDVIETPRHPEHKGLPPYSHRYRDSLTAQGWNCMRNGRMVLHSIISKVLFQSSLETTESSSSETTEQLRKSNLLTRRLKLDVLASIPQHLGIAPLATESSPANPFAIASEASLDLISKPPIACTSRILEYDSCHLPIMRTFAQNILWSLTLIARLSSREDEMRSISCNYIRLVGRTYGLRQAQTIAENLESKGYV